MRAKFIYEKFEQESDPIHDMEIGRLNLSDDFDTIYNNVRNKAAKEWIDFLNKTLVGKTFKGSFLEYINSRYGYGRYNGWWSPALITIKVVSIEEDIQNLNERTITIKGRKNKTERLKKYKILLKNNYEIK
jgi:hypothetical protein